MKTIKNKILYWAVLAFVVFGCSSDYKVVTGDFPPAGDTSTETPVPDVDTQGTEDTTEPEDTTPTETATEPEVEEGNPIAICDVTPNPVHPPVETATWDGSASYDEQGYAIIAHQWSLLSKPAGSAVTIPNGSNAVIVGFQPDLAGEYVGFLVVTNELGDTGSCEATLESIPAENLWVEMYWMTAPDDMDLHLLNTPNWMSAIETNNDCYYLNCTPTSWWGSVNWGSAGDLDDPHLDLDDIQGTGPENINIQQPQPWVYTVVVHDYTGSTADTYGDNEVTVNVYVTGTLQWTDTKTISGDGSYTPFCHIDWAGMSIISL